MVERTGDIWTWHGERQWIVIATNIGWKRDGSCPMGAGIAAAAALKYPDLPLYYGARCRKYGAGTAVCLYEPARFVLFPTKPLDEDRPWLSWQADADPDLIRRSAIQLQKLGEIMYERRLTLGKIALPLVGCENGGLGRQQVVPILRKHLDDRFVLVERG